MRTMLQRAIREVESCDCGHPHHPLRFDEVLIKKGTLKDAAAYLSQRSVSKAAMLVDQRTYEAAGSALKDYLAAEKVRIHVVELKPNENGDVLADEITIVQALLEIPQDCEMVIAVGAGTIHDIARFVSFKMKLPFLSVPTAPSVDGFNSMGAPLIVRGEKRTFQLHAPVALFADLNVLTQAPRVMRAAGFGDMIGKFTSLTDWTFSHLIGGEPFCPAVYRLTEQALKHCLHHMDEIAAGSEEGVRALMEGLILSGVAMLVFGHSHPASGGEHHLSHYWEMSALKANSKQQLHGAKVGVSSQLVADRYKQELTGILRQPEAQLAKWLEPSVRERLWANREKLEEALRFIPDAEFYRDSLDKMGGATSPDALGIDEQQVRQGLKLAHRIRDRYTILRFLNELEAKGLT